MTNTLLLIWEEIPEDHKLYALDASSEQAAWARASVGKFIDGDELPDDHDIFKLSDWLGTADAPISLDNDQVIVREFSEVVICGFFI